MSRSPYFFVERYDHNTKRYELQHPIVWNYNHTKQEMADLFPYNGCHELFSILEEQDDSINIKGIHRGLPQDCCQDIVNQFNECFYEDDWGGETRTIEPEAHWFTYADMYISCLEHPEVRDWDIDDQDFISSPKMKPTPLTILKNRVDAFLEVMDSWDWQNDYSQIRIVYWIL